MGWQELALESEALQGNPLGDPATRPLFVWTPPGYDAEPERRYPTIYLLHAMTSQARAWFNVSPFTPSFGEQLDALELDAVLVAVDGFTSLGGAQWIDSPAIGDYGRYLCDDVVGFVDAQLPDAAGSRAPRARRERRRAVSGRWSGRCSGPTCSAASPRTPATRSST